MSSSNYFIAGHLSLAPSGRSYRLELEIEGKKYVRYVSVNAVEKAKRNPKFVAVIVGLVNEWKASEVEGTKRLLETA
jgi:hypothetical protein